jgi:hypothetical protein
MAAFAIEFKPIERQFLVDQYTPEISALLVRLQMTSIFFSI